MSNKGKNPDLPASVSDFSQCTTEIEEIINRFPATKFNNDIPEIIRIVEGSTVLFVNSIRNRLDYLGYDKIALESLSHFVKSFTINYLYDKYRV